jgi:hypothetical protein
VDAISFDAPPAGWKSLPVPAPRPDALAWVRTARAASSGSKRAVKNGAVKKKATKKKR